MVHSPFEWIIAAPGDKKGKYIIYGTNKETREDGGSCGCYPQGAVSKVDSPFFVPHLGVIFCGFLVDDPQK
jgi:hypothetical protein